MTLLVAISIGAFGFGMVVGAYVNYFIETRPALDRHSKLTHMIYTMKRQGFVPQFEIEQASTPDPSNEVMEY